MSVLSPYSLLGSDDFRDDTFSDPWQVTQMGCQPFVSLLELVSEIYRVNLCTFPCSNLLFFFLIICFVAKCTCANYDFFSPCIYIFTQSFIC